MKSMKWAWVVLLAASMTAICCDHDVYEIKMTSQDGVLTRELTVYRTGEPTSQPASEPVDSRVIPEKFQSVAKLYPTSLPTTNPGRYQFVGQFRDKTPDDVGGSGYFTSYKTDMGLANVYVETFRGNQDICATVEGVLKASDQITDVLIGWFSQEMKGDPRLPELRQFMDKEFRRDIKNVGLYVFLTNIPELKPEDVGLRAAKYLADRGYFTAAEVPLLNRTWSGMKFGDFTEYMPVIQRIIAKRMGVAPAEPLPASLKFLATTQQAGESFNNYVTLTDDFKNWAKARLDEKNKVANKSSTQPASQPTPNEYLGEKAGELVLLHLPNPAEDEVNIEMVTAVKPISTNGTFDEESGSVKWDFSLKIPGGGADRGYPQLCQAVWAIPNVEFQKAHFGKVVLADSDLLDYCLWRKSLSAEEAAKWDAFIGDLKPSADLADKIKAFRFTPIPAGTSRASDEPRDYADSITDKLVSALKETTTQPATSLPADTSEDK